ncbi:MAG: corrinoid protein [Planctomycetota bacterium]|nr:corrinoid protein [Planctomycetota bacterium]MCX8040713.1 corrinoid protein [Planctomycetota bacterium]MDW8372328.1 corrinoid protein [Planctomycetota bacterium]
MPRYQDLYDAVVDGDAKTAKSATERLLQQGVDAGELLSDALIPAMDEVGRRFECNEYFVPELLIAARAMKAAMELIRPKLAATGVQPVATVVIGTVKGDLHDIGKNLVAAMLEGGGFAVHDLGVDVPPERFVGAVQEKKPEILAMSALLTTTMPAMRETIQALIAAGIRDQVKVIVGGAPVTESFARDIGADGYSDTASAAVQLARRLVGK